MQPRTETHTQTTFAGPLGGEPATAAPVPGPIEAGAAAASAAAAAGRPRRRRGLTAAAVAGLLLVGVAAGCSDEDGDGGTLDEEVTEAENDGERVASTVADATGSAVTEVQQQLDEGAEESDEG